MLKIVTDDGTEHVLSEVERLWVELDDLLHRQQDEETPDLFSLRQALNAVGFALCDEGLFNQAVMA